MIGAQSGHAPSICVAALHVTAVLLELLDASIEGRLLKTA
jgi:hypothetical protein